MAEGQQPDDVDAKIEAAVAKLPVIRCRSACKWCRGRPEIDQDPRTNKQIRLSSFLWQWFFGLREEFSPPKHPGQKEIFKTCKEWEMEPPTAKWIGWSAVCPLCLHWWEVFRTPLNGETEPLVFFSRNEDFDSGEFLHEPACPNGHRLPEIFDFVLSDARHLAAEVRGKERLKAIWEALGPHSWRIVRIYTDEQGIRVFEYEDVEDAPREPGADDDDLTPVAAAQPAATEVKSGPLRLRDLLFSPSREGVRATPPRRRFLLKVPGDGTGVFPAGKVGVLSAPGGTGKSFALMHIAFAVATGTTAFGEGMGWTAEGPGRVLFLFGEDDREEVERRLHHVLQASGITSDEDLGLIEGNLDLMPLCGQPVALTTSLESGVTVLPETQRCEELRQILQEAVAEGRPYSLVVLDPLSRFAGPDVEIDNAAATRFIQVLESLASPGCGGPSLLISHHERKRQLTDDPDSADAMRGASALKDGVRWMARLEPRRRKENAPDLLKLRVVKTNYTKPGLNLTLCRPPNWHGALRVATSDEIDAYEQSTSKGAREPGAALPERILSELARGAGSTNELHRDRLHVNKRAVSQACERLEEEGKIERRGQKWVLRATNAGAPTP